ncbi:hypothetical protein ES708_06824 [subsurface metagenome]
MVEKEKLEKIEEIYESILNSIETQNHKETSDSFKKLSNIEAIFLEEHRSRKKEGAYYTQKIISDFMISQGLSLFLNKNLKDTQFNNLNDVFKVDDSVKKFCEQKLLNTSIFDPACGSGVFLLSSANQICKIIKKRNSEFDINKIKLEILENLYGSEINDSARKLCILKLFKWCYNESNPYNSRLLTTLKSNILLEDSLKKSSKFKFDLIIGNPPYGNILDVNQKKKLKLENIFYNDIYCAFLLKSLNWTNGIIGYLVPKSFLLRQGYIKFRQNLFSNANLLKIYDIGPNLFSKATNEVQILFYENKSDTIKDIEIFQYPNSKITKYQKQNVDSLRICFNSMCPLSSHKKKIYAYTWDRICPYCDSKTTPLNRIRIKTNREIINLINKIEITGDLNYLSIRHIPNMIRGEEDKGLRQILSLIQKNVNNSCFFIKAKEDFDYYNFKRNKSFNIEMANPKILKGKNFEFYTNPKLLIKHNNIFPQATFSKENVCFTSSIYSIIGDDHIELKFLCAILNSSLMQFYCLYGINNQKNTTINLNQYMIRHLPIKNTNLNHKKDLSKKVQTIIHSLIDSNGKLDDKTIHLLREIDEIIFELYDITDDERELIISTIKNQVGFYKKVYD